MSDQTKKTIFKWLKEKNEGENKANIFCPPMEAQEAIDFLQSYLLGDNWCTPNPVSNKQVNTEIVLEILEKYSRKFRAEKKQHNLREAERMKNAVREYLLFDSTPIADIEYFLGYPISAAVLEELERHINKMIARTSKKDMEAYYDKFIESKKNTNQHITFDLSGSMGRQNYEQIPSQT